MPMLVRLVQTVRSLDANVLNTLSNIDPRVLLNTLGGNSPQQKMIVQQILSVSGVLYFISTHVGPLEILHVFFIKKHLSQTSIKLGSHTCTCCKSVSYIVDSYLDQVQ